MITKWIYILLMSMLVWLGIQSCSTIEEGACRVKYIDYMYPNNIGEDATDQIYKMTDFIFSKSDSVLRYVNDNITNGQRRRRTINFPDGEWIIITYGNLGAGSRVEYTIGSTKLGQMSTKVVNTPSYSGTYAKSAQGQTVHHLGDSDKLYFGQLELTVKGGVTDRIHKVNMSNAHIWLSAVVRWKDPLKAPSRAEDNLHVRLEYVPVEHSFEHDTKHDNQYDIQFHVPKITDDIASHISQLLSNTYGSDNEFQFDTYGLRWETGKAPVLRFYDGEKLLVDKDLDLNRYFLDQKIDLTNSRVQFYQIQMTIDGNTVIMSPIGIENWEDGGEI